MSRVNSGAESSAEHQPVVQQRAERAAAHGRARPFSRVQGWRSPRTPALSPRALPASHGACRSSRPLMNEGANKAFQRQPRTVPKTRAQEETWPPALGGGGHRVQAAPWAPALVATATGSAPGRAPPSVDRKEVGELSVLKGRAQQQSSQTQGHRVPLWATQWQAMTSLIPTCRAQAR